jgi:hypothetical protein
MEEEINIKTMHFIMNFYKKKYEVNNVNGDEHREMERIRQLSLNVNCC